MHSQRFQSPYTPKVADPPQQSAEHRPVFPRPNPARTYCSGQTSAKVRTGSRRPYHTDFQHVGSAAKGSPLVRSPNKEYSAGTCHILRETPELMREKQEEFLRAVLYSCKVAGSAVGMKPTSPHLHPCESPRGPVSPLTLGEAEDYFTTEIRLATMTPTMGSGVVSARSLRMSVKEMSKDGRKS
jgi:hypothetical protein